MGREGGEKGVGGYMFVSADRKSKIEPSSAAPHNFRDVDYSHRGSFLTGALPGFLKK
jgi:hypothetical protein